MKIQPLVSVILPIYNGQKYLKEAVNSILQQDYPAMQILLVDDGSTDGSGEIAKSFKETTYLHQSNQGVAAARNLGLKSAQGEFIAFLDQDDLWHPNKMRAQVSFLLEKPDLDFCLSTEKMFLEAGASKPPWLQDRMLVEHTGFILGAALIRAAAFHKVGPFDTRLRFGNDADWFFRAKDMGMQWEVIKQVHLLKRVHWSNESHQTTAMRADMFQLIRASIGRQKEGSKS